MLQNAYFLAKIGADTAKNERNFAEFLPKIGNYPAPLPLPASSMSLMIMSLIIFFTFTKGSAAACCASSDLHSFSQN